MIIKERNGFQLASVWSSKRTLLNFEGGHCITKFCWCFRYTSYLGESAFFWLSLYVVACAPVASKSTPACWKTPGYKQAVALGGSCLQWLSFSESQNEMKLSFIFYFFFLPKLHCVSLVFINFFCTDQDQSRSKGCFSSYASEPVSSGLLKSMMVHFTSSHRCYSFAHWMLIFPFLQVLAEWVPLS